MSAHRRRALRVGVPLGRKRRLGVHVFRYGIHFKLRWVLRWWHLVIKLTREHDLGQRNRWALWIGFWRSEKGYRGPVTGAKFSVSFYRLKPSRRMRVPVYPTRARENRRDAA